MKKPILVVLISTVLVLILIVTQFVMAIHRGGAKAETTIYLNSPVPEAVLSEFDRHMREVVDGKCVHPESGVVCRHWRPQNSVWVRIWENDEEYAVIIESSPRYVLYFGSPRFNDNHKRIEASILEFWNAEVTSVEYMLR